MKHSGKKRPAAEENLLRNSGMAHFHTAEVLVRTDQKLHTVPVTGSGQPEIPAAVRQTWQRSLSLLTETLGLTGGLLMRVTRNAIEVDLRAGEPGPGYAPGASFPFGTGSYCENVLGQDSFLLCDLTQADGSPCADGAAAGFRSYCGLPLHWPDGAFFGTLCLLSRDAICDGDRVRSLVQETGASMEKDLELLCLRRNCDGKYEKYALAMEALLQYSPGGIFAYSAEADEQFSFISENMLAFLGYTKEEFDEKFANRFSLMIYEPDRERTLREIDEQIRRGPFDNCEYRIEKKDGSLVWVHDEGHIVADETGKKWFYVVIVDITENVRAQQREREQFRVSLQRLLEANPEAIGTLQLNLSKNRCGEAHSLSRTAQRLMDAPTADEYFANIAAEILVPEQRDAFLREFNCAALLKGFAAGKSSCRCEFSRMDDDTGARIFVRLYLNLLRNPDTGDVEGVIYSLDVSEEKRRDEILRILTSQEYDLIALIDLDAATVEAYFLGDTLPGAFRKLLPAPGAVCDLAAFRANAVEKWVHPDDRALYHQCSEPSYYLPLMDSTGHYEFVLRECFPDVAGGVMYRKFQHYYLNSSKNTILVVESDVTEESRRQALALEKANAETERVKDILDSITTGICVLHMPDPEHLQIEYVNRQMFRMLGFEPTHSDGSNLSASQDELVLAYAADAFTGVHPDDLARVRATFRDNYRADYFIVENYRTLGSDGRYFWIKEEVRLREVRPDCRVFYATYHDVTEEVRLNSELTAQLAEEKELRREATAANAAKSDFLSRMSHDIRTPLNGIIGMTYLALEQDNPPRTADCLAKIDTSSKFLLGLINDVLDMSRAESNRIELNPEPYPLAEFNGYLDAVIRPLCREKGQNFLLDETDAHLELVPLADKLRLNQILFNLLSNAVKYTPEGGTISYRISGRVLGPDRIAMDHEIADNGIGMSESFQRVLFDPFTQEARDDNSETRGTGLGLAIVKKLVDLMGGTIQVQSAAGAGSTFSLHLEFRAVPAADGTAAPAAHLDADAPDLLRGRHILLCEDHPLNQEIVRCLLEQKGALVEIAGNGKQGVDCFAGSPLHYFDAVLMDIRMPVMDGLQAARAIRALPRPDAAGVPILAMTADAFSDDVRKCLDSGMNGHLSKPVDPQVLFSALSGLFG